MNNSGGQTPGHRDVLVLVFTLVASTKSSGLPSTVVPHTQFSGLRSTSRLMVSRYVGDESTVKQAGTPISCYGNHVQPNLTFYSKILLHSCRLCFALYLITIILFIFLIRYAAILMTIIGILMTIIGILMVFACFTYGIIILNEPPLVLPWNKPNCPLTSADEDCTIFMTPTFNWSWYLTLITGLATTFLALLILFLDYFFPRIIAPVFHHNVVEDDDIFAMRLRGIACMHSDIMWLILLSPELNEDAACSSCRVVLWQYAGEMD